MTDHTTKISTAKNGGDKMAKGKQETVQNKPDDKRVKTIVPDNDNGAPGPSAQKASAKK